MSRTLFTSRGTSLRSEVNQTALKEFLSLDALNFATQVHGTNILFVDSLDQPRIEADAVITQLPKIGVGVLTADCLPILIDGGDIVAAVHAGRRGLLAGIIESVVDQMASKSSHRPDTFRATIGPSICGRCYEVSDEMYKELTTDFPTLKQGVGERRLNLQAEALHRLCSVGVSLIHDMQICTLEDPRYFSYRGGDISDRQAAVIAL